MIADLMVVLAAHQGAANAISADELLATMRRRGHKLPHMKNLRDLIHDARQARHVIASCQAGYFLPTTLNEAMDSINRTLRTPGGDLMHTARILRQAAREQFGGQLRLM